MASHSRRSAGHRTAYSAGGVIFRMVDRRVEVALIATSRGGRWGLPKGHVNRGETAEAAALREVAEETGLEGEIVQHLATIEYWFRAGSSRVHKYVDLFLMRYARGDVRPQEAEVDDARWVDLDEALQMVSFERERDVLRMVDGLIRDPDRC
jgi:8-oxo-dGTP diphosphatase